MPASFKYLDNAITQGQGRATIMPAGDVGSAFMESIKGIKAQRQKEIDEKKAKKEAAKKSAEEYSIDYALWHQSHFSKEYKAIMDRISEAMAKDMDFSDTNNEEMAKLRKDMALLASSANTSKKMGTYMDMIYNMTPEAKSKLSMGDLAAANEFLQKPFDEQLTAWTTGKAPQLGIKVDKPTEQISNYVQQVYSQLPQEYFTKTDAELATANAKTKEAFGQYLQSVVSEDMFKDDLYILKANDPTTKKTTKDLKDEYVARMKDSMIGMLKDFKTKEQFNQQGLDRATQRSIAFMKSGGDQKTPTSQTLIPTLYSNLVSPDRQTRINAIQGAAPFLKRDGITPQVTVRTVSSRQQLTAMGVPSNSKLGTYVILEYSKPNQPTTFDYLYYGENANTPAEDFVDTWDNKFRTLMTINEKQGYDTKPGAAGGMDISTDTGFLPE